jgi:hypothetical protein
VNPPRRSTALGAVAAVLVSLAYWAPGDALAAGNPRQGKFSGQVSIGGGRELYLRCAGRGSPTVIMESGIHDSSDAWTVTQPTFPLRSSPAVFQGVARALGELSARPDPPGSETIDLDLKQANGAAL